MNTTYSGDLDVAENQIITTPNELLSRHVVVCLAGSVDVEVVEPYAGNYIVDNAGKNTLAANADRYGYINGPAYGIRCTNVAANTKVRLKSYG